MPAGSPSALGLAAGVAAAGAAYLLWLRLYHRRKERQHGLIKQSIGKHAWPCSPESAEQRQLRDDLLRQQLGTLAARHDKDNEEAARQIDDVRQQLAALSARYNAEQAEMRRETEELRRELAALTTRYTGTTSAASQSPAATASEGPTPTIAATDTKSQRLAWPPSSVSGADATGGGEPVGLSLDSLVDLPVAALIDRPAPTRTVSVSEREPPAAFARGDPRKLVPRRTSLPVRPSEAAAEPYDGPSPRKPSTYQRLLAKTKRVPEESPTEPPPVPSPSLERQASSLWSNHSVEAYNTSLLFSDVSPVRRPSAQPRRTSTTPSPKAGASEELAQKLQHRLTRLEDGWKK
jgi:hypothetical protein